ncbi:DUF1828 domain-containing protein [Massilia sp. CCM 8734]|uniref:DUF1828 domain-containing protein n=1 Tax=Massilia sp. CCM 8734 TaxID=2609283 RepID=UPI001423253A|nr:DUF1828 domain-containing protein [Massilia sp. CCM 8734]NHZ98858.1 DUF1828 domain-containing protein [Massilia sp. CCM 8734]
MNCEKLASITGWQCSPAGVRSVRAVAPIPMGDGGQLIAFYISQPSDSTFFLTDASETAIHAEQEGVVLNKSRIDALNRTFGVSMAEFGNDFSIEASGSLDSLQGSLWDAVKLALALSYKTASWRPKFAQAKFHAVVLRELQAQLGMERVVAGLRVQGASGHMIEFPVSVIQKNGQIIYVQPIALENGKISWPTIYEAHGKLFDVKVASDIENRIAVLEAGALPVDFGRAASFLAHAAPVYTLDKLDAWAHALI